MIICNLYVWYGKCLRYPKNPSKSARVQWHPCTLPIVIYGDVLLTYIYDNFYFKDHQSPPYTKGVLGHRAVSYNGGGSRSTRRESPGHSAETGKPKRCQKIDYQVKVGDNFYQPRPQSTHYSLGINEVCGRMKITLVTYWTFQRPESESNSVLTIKPRTHIILIMLKKSLEWYNFLINTIVIYELYIKLNSLIRWYGVIPAYTLDLVILIVKIYNVQYFAVN